MFVEGLHAHLLVRNRFVVFKKKNVLSVCVCVCVSFS